MVWSWASHSAAWAPPTLRKTPEGPPSFKIQKRYPNISMKGASPPILLAFAQPRDTAVDGSPSSSCIYPGWKSAVLLPFWTREWGGRRAGKEEDGDTVPGRGKQDVGLQESRKLFLWREGLRSGVRRKGWASETRSPNATHIKSSRLGEV